MNRKDIIGLSGTAILPAFVALPIGWLFGSLHWLAAAVAIGLLVPTAFATLWLSRRLATQHPLGAVMGMAIGILVRLIVGFGGGFAIFFVGGAFDDLRVGFWVWLLAIYVGVLVVETALLAMPIRTVNGTLNA